MPLHTLVTLLMLSVLLCWSLCFLVSDAHIFGIDTTAIKEYGYVPDNKIGIIPIRQKLLRYRPIVELFSCYFCLAVWISPIAIVLVGIVMDMISIPTTKYLNVNSDISIVLVIILLDLIVSPCVYILDIILAKIESTNA